MKKEETLLKFFEYIIKEGTMKLTREIISKYHVNPQTIPSLIEIGKVKKFNSYITWVGSYPTQETVDKIALMIKDKYSSNGRKTGGFYNVQKYLNIFTALYESKKGFRAKELDVMSIHSNILRPLKEFDYVEKRDGLYFWIADKPTKEDVIKVKTFIRDGITITRKKGDDQTKLPLGQNEFIKYSENVSMTKAQYDGLCERHGSVYIEEMIEKLKNYKFSTGKKYKSDYHTLLNWISRATDNLTDEKAIEHLKTSKNAIYEIIKIEREKIGEMPTKDSANAAIEMMQGIVDNGYTVIKVLMQNDKYGIFKCKKITV